jgi:hypothetical protein
MSLMSAQGPDVLIAIIAVALHGSNIFSFLLVFAGQVKGRVEGEPQAE